VSAVGTEVTAREAEVLALVGRNLTNAQIATELVISVRTVESHISALLRKLQVPDRRALAVEAIAGREVAPAGLPVPVTPFIGRESERSALTRALAEHRLVTAAGPGGIGKSRLAISVAADRRGDVWFVDLVRVTDPAAVLDAVAEVVRVPEQLATSPEAAVVASLGSRSGLLVLDNCEHLLDGVRNCVDRLLTDCPRLTVLATSRIRLMLPYERVYAVPGLSVTEDGGDAVTLFTARVREATGDQTPPDRERVALLCQALDGMPLAIELAASRYPTLGLDGLEAGLHERLRFFSVGSPSAGRHRSLRDTIAWSYDLLAPADQALLAGVAVFASWFDAPAAHEVAVPTGDVTEVADGLARLADHSLLLVDRGEPTRYRALETIRQYGVERLEAAGDLTEVQDRHDALCRAVLADLAAVEPDDAWCARFDRIVDDARSALRRGAGDPSRAASAAELAAQLAGQLWLRGRVTESQRRYEQAAEFCPEPATQVEYLRLAAGAAGTGYGGEQLLRLLRAAADVAITLGDRGGAARDLAWMSLFITRAPGIMSEPRPPEEADALLAEARDISDGSPQADAAIFTAQAFADYRELSVERAEEAVALARQAGDATMEDAALDLLTALHLKRHDLPAALDAIRRRDIVVADLAMDARNGFEHSDHCQYAAEVQLAAGDLPAAAGFADRMARLPFHREEDFLGLSRRLQVDALAGRFDAVLRNGEEFRLSWERIGRPIIPNLAGSAYAVAMVHGILGDDAGRAAWVELTSQVHGPGPRLSSRAWMPTFDAIVDLHRGQPEAAIEHLAVDLDDPDTWWHGGQTLYRPWYAAVWAEAVALVRRADTDDRIERARDAARHNPIASAMIERAAAFAAGDRDAVERLAATFEALGCPYQQQRTAVIASMMSS
jgi:predicted ATPase/DNA-binding CsgD family transcriptional regulator